MRHSGYAGQGHVPIIKEKQRDGRQDRYSVEKSIITNIDTALTISSIYHTDTV